MDKRHYIIVLFGVLLLSLHTVNASQSVLLVNNIVDSYPPLASYCIQTTDKCNLRSAWLACESLQPACEIILPPANRLYLNSTYGSLNLVDAVNVTIYGSGSVVSPGDDFVSFINYTSLFTSASPSLQLVNMTISGFGHPSTGNGGALYLLGDINLSIDRVNFVSNAAVSGGAIHISNNSLPAVITSSSFYNCTSSKSGGAVYVDNSVSLLSIDNCHFDSCIAGGQVCVVTVCILFISAPFLIIINLANDLYRGVRSESKETTSGSPLLTVASSRVKPPTALFTSEPTTSTP